MCNANSSEGIPGSHPAYPSALGFGAIGISISAFSLLHARSLATSNSVICRGMLTYGGIAQLIAGTWEFANRSTFAATAFSSFGAFYIALLGLPPQSLDAAIDPETATLLLAVSIFTGYMTV